MAEVLILEGFTLGGKPSKEQSKIKKSGEKYVISSTNPTAWTGVQLGPGVYTFHTETVAGAEQGKGNTAGKARNAIMRFLAGIDMMPKKGFPVEAMSSAGMWYHQMGHKWDYDRTGRILDLGNSFQITVNSDGSFKIEQNGSVWHQQQHDPDTKITIAYKFLQFKIDFVTDNEDVQPPQYEEVIQEGVQDGEENLEDLNGLTGIALMKRLAELSIKK